jgi:hypothetical protein
MKPNAGINKREGRRLTTTHSKELHVRVVTTFADIRMEHCTYGHRFATLLNPRGVTTVSRKYSLTVARHATVLVAVPSAVHHPANYKIKIYYFRLNLKV